MEKFRIDIKPEIKPIIKFGFALQGILVFICLPFLVFLGFQTLDIPFLSLIMFGAVVVFFLAAKKYLENVFYKEYLLVDHSSITIVHKSLLKYKEREVELKDVQYFGFVGQHEYTRHPMDNDTIDFTGLGTVEREVQFLIDDGTLEIVTEDESIRFGKNIPSWEAEEIVRKAEDFLGFRFHNKDIAAEKTEE